MEHDVNFHQEEESGKQLIWGLVGACVFVVDSGLAVCLSGHGTTRFLGQSKSSVVKKNSNSHVLFLWLLMQKWSLVFEILNKITEVEVTYECKWAVP